MDNHYEVNPAIARGGQMMQTMLALKRAWDDLVHLRGSMIAMKNTDASGNEVFAQQAVEFGYTGADTAAQQAQAAGSFAEIDSSWDAVNGKIQQMLDRHL